MNRFVSRRTLFPVVGLTLLGLAILFLIAWLIIFLAFHITLATIPILLALFVIFLIVHFVRRAGRHV